MTTVRALTFIETGLLVLLGFNALVFLYLGEWNDGLDSFAWIVLMGLYRQTPGAPPKNGTFRLRLLKVLAIAMVVIAEGSYLFEGAWLDVVYALQWLGVLLLFEIEARHPAKVRRYRHGFRLGAAGLFLSMLVVVGLWIDQGDWLTAYDALLWSLAFLVVDLGLLGPSAPAD